MKKKKQKNTLTEIDRSHFARDLLIKMLEDDPHKRISSEEVVKELETKFNVLFCL
jgi:hypothetical protein